MDLASWKIIIIVVLLLLPLGFTLLPFKLIRYVEHADDSQKDRLYRILSLLNCFSGGVFLGACLLDLFPDTQDMMDSIMVRISSSFSFPVAEFTVAMGFFIVLIVEGIVASCHGASGGVGPGGDVEESEPLISGAAVNYGAADREEAGADGHGHGHSHLPSGQAGIRSLMLVLALSLHSVIEGLAIGLQESSDQLLQLFAAVGIHKGILGFSLGLSLVRDGSLSFCRMLTSALVFSGASPLGLGIGWAVTDAGSSLAGDTANAVLQGVACGTFLYITFFEVLPHEFRDNTDRLLRTLFVVIGFGVVCCVLFLDPDVRTPNSGGGGGSP
ncbi:zinc transporter ZIP1-like [Amphibalanus amphitrite]|uniref:zinc transporter ZIP1-like n=1 Tax=Amphibalanus amphitrite TaxID=1232801 RepID=UPI001C924B9A|nr:zinc transporter ZIP1-like [Amphibalanus amphitrite]